MLGVPDDQVWRTELSCGSVYLLRSLQAPTGVISCGEHDQLAAIVGTERWDWRRARQLRESVASRRQAAGRTASQEGQNG